MPRPAARRPWLVRDDFYEFQLCGIFQFGHVAALRADGDMALDVMMMQRVVKVALCAVKHHIKWVRAEYDPLERGVISHHGKGLSEHGVGDRCGVAHLDLSNLLAIGLLLRNFDEVGH